MWSGDQREMAMLSGIGMAESVGIPREYAKEIANEFLKWRAANASPLDGMF